MKTVVTFGEIMMRLAMPSYLRFAQSLPGSIDCTFAGAESNVAGSLAILGANSRFITALPDNSISNTCISELRKLNVNTDFISIVKNGRLGIFFLETGANQRPSNVVYDRDSTSIATSDKEVYCFDKAFNNAGWFHITGITPALSKRAFEASLLAVKMAKQKKLSVSMDLNFRKKLWNWDTDYSPQQLARKCIEQILPFVDIVIGNEEDAYDILGISAKNTDIDAGIINADSYISVAQQITQRYKNVSKVAITLRESISASHNNWGAMLYNAKNKKAHFAPLDFNNKYRPYEIRNIVDRVGGGDSFGAGLIFAHLDGQLNKDDRTIISFAVAASCLAQSIKGDFNYSTKAEILRLANGNGSGRVIR